MDDNGFESINVIPFIDIMLVLLTIVLITSTFMASGALRVQLPEASPEKVTAETTLQLEIDAAGTLHYRGRPIPLQALVELLAEQPRTLPVLIRADRSLSLQSFVTVMDRVKQLGFTRVSLQTTSRG